MIALLVAAMCVTTLLTVGRATAAEKAVAARLDTAGARELAITDSRSLGLLTPAVVGHVASLSGVERAVGLGIAYDTTNAAVGGGGAKVTTVDVVGNLSSAVELTAGRWPRPGEALITDSARRALGLVDPVGALDVAGAAGSIPVVGSYEPRPPYGWLSGAVVAAPEVNAHTLTVVASEPGRARVLQDTVLAVVHPAAAGDVAVDSPVTLDDVRSSIVGDLAGYGRGTLVLVLGAGAFLVAVVVLADVLLRRTDLGRRRALGATRSVLVTLVLARTVIAAVLGTVVASTATLVVLGRHSIDVDASFAVGTAVLAVLAAAVTCVPVALVAAWQDPVKVLRTP